MTAITISTSEFRKHNKKYFDMLGSTRVYIKRGKSRVELVPEERSVPVDTLAKFAGVWDNDVYTADALIADITKSRHSTRVVEEL